MLKLKVQLAIREDIGYKLIMIKQAKVDSQHHTAVQLVDFVSVIIQNRKILIKNGKQTVCHVLFDHNYIVNFL